VEGLLVGHSRDANSLAGTAPRSRSQFHLPASDRKTLLDGSVAKRIQDPAFIAAVRAFLDEFQLPVSDLKTLLDNSVATRIQDPAFVAAVRAFLNEFHLSASSDLKTLLVGSVATRIQDPAFVDTLRRLCTSGLSPTCLQSFGGSFFSATDKGHFWNVIQSGGLCAN
jgi:antitoxin component HigA of HigAB toxin-antitoxin module